MILTWFFKFIFLFYVQDCAQIDGIAGEQVLARSG